MKGLTTAELLGLHKPETKPEPKQIEKVVKPRSRVSKVFGLPEVTEKVMGHSYMRSGKVGEGTVLSSRARQVTCSFPPAMVDKLQVAAEDQGVSLSEMIRQCIQQVFEPK